MSLLHIPLLVPLFIPRQFSLVVCSPLTSITCPVYTLAMPFIPYWCFHFAARFHSPFPILRQQTRARISLPLHLNNFSRIVNLYTSFHSNIPFLHSSVTFPFHSSAMHFVFPVLTYPFAFLCITTPSHSTVTFCPFHSSLSFLGKKLECLYCFLISQLLIPFSITKKHVTPLHSTPHLFSFSAFIPHP